MNLSTTRFVLAGVSVLWPIAVMSAQTDPGCNQLGREVALRAAEQMQAGLDAGARTELAAIAEAVCLEFTVPPASAAALAEERVAPAETAAEPRAGVLGLEIIPAEERVRRPGLKRL
jgi:hypothetical protein